MDQRQLVQLDQELLSHAVGFEAVELSPLAPLGASSAMSLTSQNKVVSALRGTEVVSDPTNVLALECARRLKTEPTRDVHLATSHRCVRAQAVPKQSGFAQHFRIFCLVSAGIERKNHGLLVETLAMHIRTHLTLLAALERCGYAFPARRVSVLASKPRAELGDRVAALVDGASMTRLELDHRYYDGLRFRIDVGETAAGAIPLIDGGAFDWLRRLTSNRRATLVASALGSQLVAALFRRPS